jgi:hypothetical protein
LSATTGASAAADAAGSAGSAADDSILEPYAQLARRPLG